MRATSAFLSARLAVAEALRLLEAGVALVRANQRQAQRVVTEEALRQSLHILGADGIYAPQHVVQLAHLAQERLAVAQPPGDAVGVLQAQDGAALDVLLRPCQLVCGNRFPAHKRQLAQNGAHCGDDAPRLDAGADDEGPRIVKVHRRGADVVGKPLFLAHTQEEARAHAVAEDGVRHRLHVGIRVVA